MSKEFSADAIPGEIRTPASTFASDPARKLGEKEIKAAYALISYLSYNLKIEGAEIIQMTCKTFGASKIEDIPLAAFNDLIGFLVDFTGSSDTKN